MTALPLGIGSYIRRYGRSPEIELINRFFEQDPTNTVEGSALLTRPPTAFLVAGGGGPIRGTYSQAGAFNGDLFFVSDNTLFRWDGTTRTAITGVLGGSGHPEVTFVTGPAFEYLFIADGLLLQGYDGTSRALGTLTLTPSSPPDIATQKLQFGTTYYQWVASGPSPTAVGTVGDPFEVLVGSDDAESLANLALAINSTGTAGTEYSATITTPNTIVSITSTTATTAEVRAIDRGTDGNSVATVVTSGSDLAFGAATLSGGGIEALFGVTIPDGNGASSLASIGGHTVIVTANSDKWYFLRPGEIEIRALDFFHAEEEPDEIVSVVQVGDQLLFFGQTTIEAWYLTGEVTEEGDTFLPIEGRAFSIGAVPGTIVKVKDFVMFVGTDNIVYRMTGQPEPIRNNAISERIRVARAFERENP